MVVRWYCNVQHDIKTVGVANAVVYYIKLSYNENKIIIIIIIISAVTLPPRSDTKIQLRSKINTTNQPLLTGSRLLGNTQGLRLKSETLESEETCIAAVVSNKNSHSITIPADSELIEAKLAVPHDNILHYLTICLEKNRKREITLNEGVTSPDDEYWEAINNLDLESSILTKTEKEILLDEVFAQRGALALKDEIGCLREFQYRMKMANDTVVNKESYPLSAIG